MPAKKKVIEKIEEEVAFGEEIDWHKLGSPKSYYPTRLEYFAGKALQGLVTGRSEKDIKRPYHVAEQATKLAKELEEVVDTAQD
jgi:hypothetical protein